MNYNIQSERNNLTKLFEGIAMFVEDWFGQNLHLFFSDWEEIHDDNLPFALNFLYELSAEKFMHLQNDLLSYEHLEKDGDIVTFMHENQCVWKAGYSILDKDIDPFLWLTHDLKNWEKQQIRISEFLINHLFSELYIGSRYEYKSAGQNLLLELEPLELLWVNSEYNINYRYKNGILVIGENSESDLYSMEAREKEKITWEKFYGYDIFSPP